VTVRTFLTGLRAGDVGEYVLLPGDPGRCESIARLFDEGAFVASNREFTTWSGSLDGTKVSVVSTGMGCASAAAAVGELVGIGAHTLLRVGTAGDIQDWTTPGDLAIISAAIRDEGTTLNYVPAGYPAVANPQVVDACIRAAAALDAPFHVGVAHCKDSFYAEVEPEAKPVSDSLVSRWRSWREGGAICSEMESAGVFVMGSIHRVRSGAIVQLWADGPQADDYRLRLLRVSVEALRQLIADDRRDGSWP
jgi:uridine phosphorylase